MEEDVQLLFAYARRGDVQSLAALVRRHATWMQALLRGMLPVAADVDDVFQETWMRVIRAAPRYRGGMVKPYLATVARSAAIDHLRRTRAVVSLDDEAVRVVSASPKWRPGRHRGKKVKVAMTVTVEFRLEKKGKFGINGKTIK